MKKHLLILFIFCTTISFAKKIKFSVDMTDVTIQGSGVHITGNFQVVAGLASDSFNTLTPLEREGTSNIYSLVVDIPAFHKYEYKFINGDFFYDAEFVPEISRVGGDDFIDNRWIYVDSLDNSTTDLGPIVYAGNSPAGTKLLKVKLDPSQITVSTKGLHVATSSNGISFQQTAMYSLFNGIYEALLYVNVGETQYRFFNGTTLLDAETVLGSCANTLGNRSASVMADTVVEPVCFAKCIACTPTGIYDETITNGFSIYPNPSNGEVTINLTTLGSNNSVTVTTIAGQKVASLKNASTHSLSLNSGLYFVSVQVNDGKTYSQKLIVK